MGAFLFSFDLHHRTWQNSGKPVQSNQRVWGENRRRSPVCDYITAARESVRSTGALALRPFVERQPKTQQIASAVDQGVCFVKVAFIVLGELDNNVTVTDFHRRKSKSVKSKHKQLGKF